MRPAANAGFPSAPGWGRPGACGAAAKGLAAGWEKDWVPKAGPVAAKVGPVLAPLAPPNWKPLGLGLEFWPN